MKQIAEELGAGFAVEGGVRKGGNRVRITAQPKNVPAKASATAMATFVFPIPPGPTIVTKRYCDSLAASMGMVSDLPTIREVAPENSCG